MVKRASSTVPTTAEAAEETLALLRTIRMSKQQKMDLIPPSLASRDKGGMFMPQRVFLLWLRNLDETIKESSNPRAFQRYGQDLIKVRNTKPGPAIGSVRL